MKELSKEEILFIKKIHSDASLSWDKRMAILMERFEISERTVRRWLTKLGFTREDKDSDQYLKAKNKNLKKSKFYLITWAQSNAKVHEGFLQNLEAYGKFLNAEICVIAGKYRNPDSTDKSPIAWDERLDSYLSAKRNDVHRFMTVLADVKVLPTASDPLSGLESITGDKSSIVGSPRVHLKSLAVLEGHPKKILMSTGSITEPLYIDSKVGKKAEFHHTFGAVIVEIKNKEVFYTRQITACPDGSFTDVFFNVTNRKVKKIRNSAAFICGDIHAGDLNRPVFDRTKDYFDKVRPSYLILHDVFNGKSINPHELKDPVMRYRKYINEEDSLKKEIDITLDVIEEVLKYNPVIVRSNHDIFADRWISNTDWKDDFRNAPEYFELANAVITGKAPKGVIPYVIEKAFGDKVITLSLDESFIVKDWELAYHGHQGAHGSKGNLNQFSKLNTKVVIADYHTPGRRDGALNVGTYSDLRVGYNTGGSGWVHCGAVIHTDGKCQQLIFFDNNFTILWEK